MGDRYALAQAEPYGFVARLAENRPSGAVKRCWRAV